MLLIRQISKNITSHSVTRTQQTNQFHPKKTNSPKHRTLKTVGKTNLSKTEKIFDHTKCPRKHNWSAKRYVFNATGERKTGSRARKAQQNGNGRHGKLSEKRARQQKLDARERRGGKRARRRGELS